MTQVGGVYVDLGLSSANFKKGINDARKQAKSFGKEMDGVFSGISSSFTGAFAGGFIGGAFSGGITSAVSGLRSLITETANLRAEAARAGVSLTAFQQWKAVAEDTRIPLDAMVDALKELNIRADEFATTGKGSSAEAFARIGMTPEEVQKKLRDPSQLMQEIIDKTKALNNQAAATRIFDEVFGGTGAEQAVRLLDQADGGIQSIMQSAQDAGRILDETMIKRAEDIDKEFNTLWRNFESSAKNAILNVSVALKDGLAKDMANIASYMQDFWNNPSMENFGRVLMGDANDMRVAGAHGPATASDPALVEAARRKYGKQPTEITVTPKKTTKSTKSTGGSKSRVQAVDEALREAEAVKELIKDLQFEAALVGKSALEKEKMNAIRQAGAAATAEQKAEIESLIESTYRQNEAWEKSQEQLQALNDAGRDFAGTMISGLLNGAKASDVLADAIGRLADRFLNSGLDALFGGGGGFGGLLGGIFGGVGKSDPWSGLRLAGGGHVSGPGSSTSDSIFAKLSNGEFVVNAKATKQNRGILEAINKGIPLEHFAQGGAAGIPKLASITAPRIPTLSSMSQTNNNTTNSAPVINVNVNGATGNAEVAAMVQQGVAKGIQAWQGSTQFASAVAFGTKQANKRGMLR
ncbi:hypothetical protein L7D45_09040 [Brucella pseudogrignonensis]|uniref:hypothetical protein n=1 Tax=Brucella pseudogrignonensis TaxID=419475 RepID=UPI001EDB64D6|nr:hypothetical protein [Brucella pseudogrignonensis]UKK92055.1 hypothetical protein L7D45_09040 [Brucella pseudogrignonensis]